MSSVAGIETSFNRGREGFWVDYDNDGKLDLFVKNGQPANGHDNFNRLYKNNGGGRFTLIPGAAGLEDAAFGVHGGTVTSFVDYDNDGLMDVAFSGNEGAPQALYRHQRDGTFVNVTAAAGFNDFQNHKLARGSHGAITTMMGCSTSMWQEEVYSARGIT